MQAEQSATLTLVIDLPIRSFSKKKSHRGTNRGFALLTWKVRQKISLSAKFAQETLLAPFPGLQFLEF